jgi:Protein of unknown function (DUF3298)/Mannan-binding protein
MRMGKLATPLIAVAAASVVLAPTAAASVVSFCSDIGGQWDGQNCNASVLSERKAVRDIQIALPGDLIDNPVMGSTLRDYLSTLMNNWKTAAVHTVQDSHGEAHFQTFQHGDVLTVVYREIYSGTWGTDAGTHPNAPVLSNGYRTFAYNMATGQRVALADVLKPGTPFAAIPPLAHPYVVDALNAAPPPHQANTHPFVPELWTPDRVYSGGYRAWALTPDELILYMPDYPVGNNVPIDYTIALPNWAMDGGVVQAHIPLAALSPILRPEFGGA